MFVTVDCMFDSRWCNIVSFFLLASHIFFYFILRHGWQCMLCGIRRDKKISLPFFYAREIKYAEGEDNEL
jgi:hypothetical protein